MRCALLGTGRMGYPMAERLLEEGCPLSVWNRTVSKASGLSEKGARVCDSASEALEASDHAVLMLSDGQAIQDVLAGSLSNAALKGKTLIQMGTIGPDESRELAGQILSAGGEYLEAPVLGSIKQIREQTLIVMAGGDRNVFEKHREFLALFGPDPLYAGPVGQAAALKLALNQMIASLTAAFSMSLGFCLREGVDTELFMSILRDSALYATTFDKKLPLMLDRDFGNPNFYTQHLLKDVELFLREAGNVGVHTEPLQGVRQVIHRALEMGLEECDYSSIYNAVNPEQ